MKNTLFVLFVWSLLGLANCSLDTAPAQSIAEGIALENDANVKSVLVGAYDELGNGDLYGGNTMRDADLLGGNGQLLWVGTFNGPREIFNKQIQVGNFDAQERWVESYETINIANNVLSALDVVNEDDRAKVEGEALFIRGLLYFDLARFYGLPYEAGSDNGQLGVPVVTEPTRGVTEESNVRRNTVEEVYTQVIDDLSRAESLLDGDANAPLATADAAAAILARVYLQMGRFADARDAANRVISSENYSLTETYADAFMNDVNSSEDIFAIQVNNQDGVNNLNTFFSIPEFGGRDGDIEILTAHLDLYEDGDDRFNLFFERGGSTLCGKYNSQFANVGVIRLAEMHLIRAEANQRLGTNVGVEPVEDIRAIRDRAGLTTGSSVTLDEILEERARELAFEGFLIHDRRRLQENVASFAYDAPELVFPIPDREIIANPSLQQNEGY